MDSAAIDASLDIRDVLVSAPADAYTGSHSVEINLIKSLIKHHRQRNEWSLIDMGLKIWKLTGKLYFLGSSTPLKIFIHHYLVAFLSMENLHKNRAIAGESRDATVNFDRYQILQRDRADSLPQHGFLV